VDFGDSVKVSGDERPYVQRDDFQRAIRTYPNDLRTLSEIEKRLAAKMRGSIDKN
jgi:hypothetical protein